MLKEIHQNVFFRKDFCRCFYGRSGVSPGTDSKESIPPAYVTWRAGTMTLFPTRLLASHNCSKIPAQSTNRKSTAMSNFLIRSILLHTCNFNQNLINNAWCDLSWSCYYYWILENSTFCHFGLAIRSSIQ